MLLNSYENFLNNLIKSDHEYLQLIVILQDTRAAILSGQKEYINFLKELNDPNSKIFTDIATKILADPRFANTSEKTVAGFIEGMTKEVHSMHFPEGIIELYKFSLDTIDAYMELANFVKSTNYLFGLDEDRQIVFRTITLNNKYYEIVDRIEAIRQTLGKEISKRSIDR